MCRFLYILLLSFGFWTNSYALAEDWQENGQTAFQAGQFEEAVQQWELALSALLQEKQTLAAIDTALQLNYAYQALGLYQTANDTLHKVLDLAKQSNDAERYALVLNQLGMLYLANREISQASELVTESVNLARPLNNPALLAELLNNLGNVFALQQDYLHALEIYQESALLAERSGDNLLLANVLNNQIQLYIEQKNFNDAQVLFEKALKINASLPDNYDKAFNLITLGQLAQSSNERLLAYQRYTEALTLANKLSNNRISAYAQGYMGELYVQEARYSEAEQLFNQAIFLAQKQSAPDLLYYWQWQKARLLKRQGRTEEAIAIYQQAIETVQPIRAALNSGYRTHSEASRQSVRLMYFELADLLLQKADTTTDEKPHTAYLTHARDTVELLKAAELQDYFQDDCVTNAKTNITESKPLTSRTAILYPIVLPERLVLLVTLPNSLKQTTVDVTEARLGEEVNNFRTNLVTRTNRRFFVQAQQLYDWLIRPIEANLQAANIDTIVVVPDGILRTIPLAPLFDGKQFLIERYALATTPGINLTDPKQINWQKPNVLLNGLSKSVQDFSPLPNVPEEINKLKQVLSTDQVLEDDAFLLGSLSDKLKNTPYSVIHIASHGQFDADPQKTFLLTFDGKLTIDRLEQLMRLSQWRKEPVELLTLSACQTAVGDDRAALGLAGIAIKAGARSALASLWFVDDRATADLMVTFYQQLQSGKMSRAKALQYAQQKLLKQGASQHPAYWAAFLLIGSWL
ncbi:CHAT domain-containing protein [Beggiatoa leptomitoformis]|uniref:CHAT domain-containing protein n=1 Tax=Beggiatoa leptomitoformis TaxID=288004 RepID=A0A2N9YGD5_9GAMM|nr:CHAT domain-containing protein [Beggiatoa leptomitoformis]ALG68120.1 CHAT domain-containing protein [Beggiatoa leptomitoformis]AUI69582.1 CHAT domain-containing protein [Beggiatoa leptomitoformis]